MWIRGDDPSMDSYTKFVSILELCDRIGIKTVPGKIVLGDNHGSGSKSTGDVNSIWIVPLFGWYTKPEEDMDDSLYVSPPPNIKERTDFWEQCWMDNNLCRWPSMPQGSTLSTFFADKNKSSVSKKYDAPVISFSHFVPRTDLIRASEDDMREVNTERRKLNLEAIPKGQGGVPGFNFTRYAGCKQLDVQIRQLGSRVHVYGHQHRNRSRVVDGVHYVSHCLGNPQEQKQGWTWGIRGWGGPKQIWPLLSDASS